MDITSQYTIDSHAHAWGLPTKTRPWVNGDLVNDAVANLTTNIVYDSSRLIADMDRNGIDEAVLVGYPITKWDDNSYTIEAVTTHSQLYGIVMVDPFKKDSDKRLTEMLNTRDILGFRLGAICPYDRMWEAIDYDSTWLRKTLNEDQFWQAAIRNEAIVQIMAHTSQFDQVIDVIESYPELRYIIDHFGHANAEHRSTKNTNREENLSTFAELSQYDRVGIKISQIAGLSKEKYPFSDVHEYIPWLLDLFDRERVFWGSDYPNVARPAFGDQSYSDTLSWIGYVEGLSSKDHKYLTGEAFKEFSGI